MFFLVRILPRGRIRLVKIARFGPFVTSVFCIPYVLNITKPFKVSLIVPTRADNDGPLGNARGKSST